MASELALLGGSAVRTDPFAAWPVVDEADEKRLLGVLRGGKWGRDAGDQVRSFEKRFAAYHQAKYAVAVVNGTVSLRLALLALQLQAGDEVIVPPYTFLATASAVVEANATPVFVDICPDTLTIDPKEIEKAVTPRTRAIIPVHVGGMAADMDAIMEIARRRRLAVIEDAAQAHGAAYGGRRLGTLGDIGSFSFQSSKNMTSGEGGILTTNDEHLADRIYSLHHCGRPAHGGAWYDHHVIGGNYRLSEFQAAVLHGQLDRVEAQAQLRERNGLHLAERLSQVPGLTPQKRTPRHARHAYHLFPIRIDPSVYEFPRDLFLKAMHAEGIPLSAGYTLPVYRQPLFQNLAFGPFTGYRNAHPDLDYRQVHCPVSERVCTVEGSWLTQNVLLGSTDDLEDVVRAFDKVHQARRKLADLARNRPETSR